MTTVWHWVCGECTDKGVGLMYRFDGQRRQGEACCFCGGTPLERCEVAGKSRKECEC